MDRRFAFYELAKYFLQSYYPRCYKEVVVLNCILDYDGPLPTNTPMRYFAHEFVDKAYVAIEQGKKLISDEPFDLDYRINQWVKENI